jgi:Tol biopolymer transport system component
MRVHFTAGHAMAALSIALTACRTSEQSSLDRMPLEHAKFEATPLERPDEPHLRHITKLTAGDENAEAYWNKEGTRLIFQSTHGGLDCDQIFTMKSDGSDLRQLSIGNGRTTCSYFQNDGSIIYASTHGHGPGCLWKADRSQGYVWPVYPQMDIWRADADGGNARVLFASDGYDAEGTICRKDGRIIFTSSMNGDLDIYLMNADGSNVRQLTNTPGYDGGAFFSPDCSKIVWRASRPEGKELDEYRALLNKNLVRPTSLEIYVMNGDGTDAHQVTHNGAANFAPYMNLDNDHILFASNVGDPKRRNFDIYLIRADGSGMEQVTTNPTFDGFPMWSDDGKKLVFASNRADARPGETNVFVADWVW